MKNQPHTLNPQRGFIALTAVLIISAVVLTISIGLAVRSVGESKMSLDSQKSHRAMALANLCAETALMKLESVFQYSGDEVIMIDTEPCHILPVEGSGNLSRTVKTQSTTTISGQVYVKKVKIVVSQISSEMRVTSWEEVSDF
jgi:hypothetical protein